MDLERLSGGEAQVSFGELTVDLTGCDTVTPDCRISANCSFGHILLLVPKYFRIVPASSSAFGSVNMVGQPNGDASDLIALEANASFGDITVRYV